MREIIIAFEEEYLTVEPTTDIGDEILKKSFPQATIELQPEHFQWAIREPDKRINAQGVWKLLEALARLGWRPIITDDLEIKVGKKLMLRQTDGPDSAIGYPAPRSARAGPRGI